MSEIAATFDVSFGDLRRWNGIARSTIYSGQSLIAYAYDRQLLAARYRVRAGDTLSGIAWQLACN